MSPSDVTDAQLMARVIEGDQAALGELYDRYAGTAYRSAYRLLGDPGWAEEVVQETMLALWDRAELYDPPLRRSRRGWDDRPEPRHRSAPGSRSTRGRPPPERRRRL